MEFGCPAAVESPDHNISLVESPLYYSICAAGAGLLPLVDYYAIDLSIAMGDITT